MDVINLISKTAGVPGGDAAALNTRGPRLHEFLQEMHREVFAGRDAELLTVGEMPGVTVEEARLFTDPARGEVDMVFTFEHMRVDQGDVEVGPPSVAPDRLEGRARALADRARRPRLELPVLGQPRPAAGGLALRRRRRAPGRGGEDAGHDPALPARDAVRLPGRGARDDERAVGDDRGLPRHRVHQPLPRGGGRRGGAGRRPALAAAHGPRQRPHARAVDRRASRRLHDRRAVAAGQPEPRRHQRRGGARGPRLGLPPLPAADHAAQGAGR